MINDSTMRSVKGTSLAIILILGVLAIGTASTRPALQTAYAAGETIQASKTTFFGSNVVEITISDGDLKDNNDGVEFDEITVSFDVRSGSDSVVDDVNVGSSASAEIGDSGKFVFYVTADEDVVESDLEDSEFGTDSQLVHITEGGDIDIGTDSTNDAFDGATDGISLNTGASITITYKDANVDLTYEDVKADITLDRTTVGTEGVIYLQVHDQDANDDPTGRDELNFDNTNDNLTMTFTGVADDNLGQIIADTAGLHFTETSDNSGIFEVRLSISTIFGILPADTPKSIKIEMQDFEVYPNDNFYDADEAGVPGDDDTSESVTVDNSDGLLQDVTNPAGPRSELVVKVLDSDRNLDSKVKDRIVNAIAADLSSSGADDDETIKDTPVDLIETGVNTGLFVPDLANNVFEVTIGPVTDNNGIVDIEDASAAKSDILVRYADFTPDSANDITTDVDNSEPGGDVGADAKVILFKGKAAANTPAIISLGQPRIGAQDKVFLVVTDPDLNDDKNSVDSFDLTIPMEFFDDGELSIGTINFNSIDIARLDLTSIINGEAATDSYPVSDIHISFQETGKDTNIFSAEFDYTLIAPAADTEEGDNTEFKWFDELLDSPLESSARLTINQATTGVAWQQNSYAVPYVQEGRNVADPFDSQVDAKRTRVKLLITDPALNQDSSTVEQKTFSILDDAGSNDKTATGLPDLSIKLVGSNGKVLLDPVHNDIDSCGGMTANTTFTETGANTGIFDKTFDFKATAGNCDLTPKELANARLVADYDDSTASTVLQANNGILMTSSRTINSGQEITITVNDPDQNHDRDVREQVEIQIEPDGLDKVPKLLDETDLNTGVFAKKFVVGEDFEILDEDQVVDDVTVTYDDAVTSNGGTSEERELKLIPPTSNGNLTISPSTNIGPGTKVTITLVDADLNDNPNSEDIINFDALKIRTDNSDIVNDEIDLGEEGLQMEETSNNSGEFKLVMTLVPITPDQKKGDSDIAFVPSGDQIDFPAEPGDRISLTYTDENHERGSPDNVNVLINVKSFDPVISTDKDAYLPGDVMTINIDDPDANVDPDVIDTVADVSVSTDEDRVGESFDVVETGANTGIFTVQVPLVEDFESGAITTRIGNTITITYTDQFPADYASRIEDVNNPDKDFTFEVKVSKVSSDGGGTGGVDIAMPSPPKPQDIQGHVLKEVTKGQQIVLSTTIENTVDGDQPFVAIIEVRDSSGVTTYLQWQTGTLNPHGNSEVGISWTPEDASEYELRTFVLSSLSDPRILSGVEKSDLVVS